MDKGSPALVAAEEVESLVLAWIPDCLGVSVRPDGLADWDFGGLIGAFGCVVPATALESLVSFFDAPVDRERGANGSIPSSFPDESSEEVEF